MGRITLDGASNSKYLWWPSGKDGTTSYQADENNRYSQVGEKTPAYDTKGNLTELGDMRCAFDKENRLTAVKRQVGATALELGSYLYDAAGRRKFRGHNIQLLPIDLFPPRPRKGAIKRHGLARG